MQHMTTAQIRQAFLDYFATQQHQIVPSSSLIPGNDATLLFNNAGMVQFKDVFLGAESRPYTRATSSQRCVRAGGKHNDLENVGYTARHHTFFEMLGNFSFGDYFKQEAITFAWQFLTDVVKLPKEKLLVTVYHTDEEAYDFWSKEIGLSDDKIIRIDTADNFWSMGDTGPCGPCSEIFYDHGEHIWGGPPGSPEEDGDRFIEIWNLVFMQYNRKANGSLEGLPSKHIDTGMGFERLCMVLQGVQTNFDTDVFTPLIREVETITGIEYGKDEKIDRGGGGGGDHVRAVAFAIADGQLPSNNGAGYVIRRILRRAIRYGFTFLNQKEPFIYKLAETLSHQMGAAFPEIKKQDTLVHNVIKEEEASFLRTLDQG